MTKIDLLQGVEILHFSKHASENKPGNLYAIESWNDIPFNIARFYFMKNMKYETTRGKHAHKHLQQVFICIEGSCDLILDNGEQKKTFTLNQPSLGIYVNKPIWREITHFSSNAVLLCVVDQIYDSNDYISKYEDYLDFLKTTNSYE